MDEKELSWRGVATATVEENPDPKKAREKIDRVIAKLMVNFPPPQK